MKLNKNVVFSLALIAFACFVIAQSLMLKSLFLSQSGDIGPKAFPIGAAVALILCALGKMLTEGRGPAIPLFTFKGWQRVLLMFAILIGYVIAMNWLGYIISTLVAVPLMVYAMSEGQRLSPVVLITFSIVTTSVLWFVFEYIIMVPLPFGALIEAIVY